MRVLPVNQAKRTDGQVCTIIIGAQKILDLGGEEAWPGRELCRGRGATAAAEVDTYRLLRLSLV